MKIKMSGKTKNSNRWKKIESLIIAIFFISLLGVLINISLSAPVHRVGDSSTYYLQISSIVNDFNIEYQPIDIHRAILNKFDDLPYGLLLIKTNDGKYFYGKEFSYAIFASPFFALLSNSGILLFNALMFWLMILFGYLYLSKKGNSLILSFFTSLLFFFLSVAVVYVLWIHVEIYNMFLITIGIYILSVYIENQKNEKYLILSAFVFGIATIAKLPNCLLFLPIIFYELYNRNFKRVFGVFLILLLPIIIFYGFFYLETGSLSFYGGNRLYYTDQFPFINGFNNFNECGRQAFSVEEGRISALVTTDVITKTPFNFFYYFFGRFSGMIWYYPLAGFALISFIFGLFCLEKHAHKKNHFISSIKKNPLPCLIFIGIILNILFYIIIIGNNYLGGEHAIGNRYFYIFPAFLFLISKVEIKFFIPFIIIALFTTAPLISDPISVTLRPENHTFAFPYNIFPVEYSQMNNIPIWIHKYKSSDYSIYNINGNCIFYFDQNLIITNGTTQWLIKTKMENPVLSLLIINADEKKQYVEFSSESYVNYIFLDNLVTEKIDIPLADAVYADTEYRIYPLNVESAEDIFIIPLNEKWKQNEIYFATGWYNNESWNSIPTRWTSGNATFLVYSEKPRNALLNMSALSYRIPKTVTIIYHDEDVTRFPLSTSWTHIQVPVSLKKGINIFQLYTPDTCERPSDITSMKSEDTRCLSIAIQNLIIQ
jgi:hypothetical protein